MKNIKIILLVLLAQWLFSSSANASDQVEMADMMRTEGKIYVVVTVMTIIFTGLAIYLFLLDKKLSKIESLVKEKTNNLK